MKDISQTKEGFIKSMILFAVLLIICFLPFFAYSAVTNLKADNEKSVNTVSVTMNTGVNSLQLSFTTDFKCSDYCLEGLKEDGTYETILYCSDAKCQDSRNQISYTLSKNETNYESIRVKARMLNGDIVYSEDKAVAFRKQKNLVLQSGVATDILRTQICTSTSYTFSISSMSGEVVANWELMSADGNINVSNLKAGFYLISFKAENGEELHYKFLKSDS